MSDDSNERMKEEERERLSQRFMELPTLATDEKGVFSLSRFMELYRELEREYMLLCASCGLSDINNEKEEV